MAHSAIPEWREGSEYHDLIVTKEYLVLSLRYTVNEVKLIPQETFMCFSNTELPITPKVADKLGLITAAIDPSY